MLQGQTVLQNDKTLHDLRLTDGTTLHMVLEPAKDTEVTIKLPSFKERKFTFSNNFTPFKVLQRMQNEGLIFRPTEDYFLQLGDKELSNDIPLHLYNINTAIKIQRVTKGLQIIDEYNERLYVTVNPKIDTILDVKRKITGRWGTKKIKVYDKLDQMRIYIEKNEEYHLLNDNCSIQNSGVENDGILYMIYYDWDPAKSNTKFYMGEWTQNGEPRITQRMLDFVGRESACGRTALSLALRIQEQYEIPAQGIEIYSIHKETAVFRTGRLRHARTTSKIRQWQFHNVPQCSEFVIFLPPGSQIAGKQTSPLTAAKTYTLSIVEKDIP